MSSQFDMKDLKRRMTASVDVLKQEFTGLRTGRASASLLDTVMVDAYGTSMPLSQVGTVSTPEPRAITVQVWDKSMVQAVEKSIRNSGLGLNPMTDGQTVRVPIPELNEERRRELTKIAGKYAEHSRVAVRNVRRDGMDSLKKMEKDGEISQDDQKSRAEEIQKITDEIIKQIDESLAHKEREILQV